MSVRGLEDACVCGRVVGDHTMREWHACLETATADLPYEDAPDYATAFRQRFRLDDDVIVADHVIVSAVAMNVTVGLTETQLPGVLHEFEVSVAGGTPVRVAKVLFVGPPDGVRGYARLVRDCANAAVKVAE